MQAGEHLQVERILGPSSHRWTLLAGPQATLQGGGASFTVPFGAEIELSFSPRPEAKRIQPVAYVRGAPRT